MKIAVDVVDKRASALLSRQLLPEARTLPSHGDDSGVISTLTGGFLAVAGPPAPAIDPTQVVDAASAASILPRYNGAFAAVFWSPSDRKLVVVSDFLGFKPLYVRRLPGWPATGQRHLQRPCRKALNITAAMEIRARS